MRVLTLTVPLPGPGGVHTMAPLARQVESLRALGAQMDVLEVRGITKVKYVQTLPALWRAAGRADLVHAHFGFCGWLSRVQLRRPVVVSFMGDDLLGTPDARGRLGLVSRILVGANRHLARLVDCAIVKSAEMARVLRPIEAHVVANGVDLEEFHPASRLGAREALGWSPQGKYVLFPGNPDTPRKGFPLAQSVIAEVSRRLLEPVTLVPLARVPPARVPVYMNACDAMLFTSFVEGSPNVVKEAMASELPTVSVAVGDVSELFCDVPGYSVHPRCVEELAGALAAALEQRPRTEGRARLRERRLDLRSVARRLVSIYEATLRGWHRPAT